MSTQARINSKEAAEENSKAGARKVKVYGFGRMKVTMIIPSAGKDAHLASAKLAYHTPSGTESVQVKERQKSKAAFLH